jgi:hypothetical protein
MKDIDNINHVGMVARNLGSTVARYEAMGFQLTPYSPHSGAWKPGAPVQNFGSGNRCVMFANNYLEILGTEDPNKPTERLAGYLARHQGAHIICFNTETTSKLDERLRAGGVPTSGVISLQRDIDTPDGVRTAKFERVQFSPDDSPEGYIQAARHLTPEYIYQPRYIEHPNGCTSLAEAFIVADDIEPLVAKYQRYLDAAPEVRDGLSSFPLPLGSTLTLAPAGKAARLFAGSLFPPLPAIVAVSFRTNDLAAQRERLARQDIPTREGPGRIMVPAEEASGLVVIFRGPE